MAMSDNSPNPFQTGDPKFLAGDQGPEPGAPSPTPTPVPPQGPQMPQGIDPRLAALYQKANMTPGDRGSGFADWQYWQDKANGSGDWDYFTNRLSNDLAGTGTDQSTGTPGSGAWQRSGSQERGGFPTGGGIGSLVPSIGYGPSLSTPNSFWNAPSPASFGQAGLQVPQSSLTQSSNDLLQQLLSRVQLGQNGLKFGAK